MDVTSVSVSKVEEIRLASIVGGYISESGQLVLVKGDDSEVNAGQVVQGINETWPIGSIYSNRALVDPTELLGGGVWTRIKGRFLVGLDENDAPFDSPAEQGGAKTVTLDITQIPSHNHGANTGSTSVSHTHTGQTILGEGGHGHNYNYPNTFANATGSSNVAVADDVGHTLAVQGDGAHQHNFTTDASDPAHSHTITAQGGGLSHENLPPYRVVYMWERTA